MSTDHSPSATAQLPPLALIAGPTASGKSDLAVRIALRVQARGGKAAVINADSAQVYADLAVLSARPTEEEMQGVPHCLFGAWGGAEACSAAEWAAAARTEIAAAHEKGVLPILVGGTGLYIRTLLDGIAPVPAIDPKVRTEVRALPVAEAYAALSREDPERAATLAPADAARIARALEVIRSTGRSLASWQAERTGGIGDVVTLRPLILTPDRAWLYERCDRRFAQMWRGGAIAEVRALLARDLDPALPVMRAIGVPEVTDFLAGRCTEAEAIAAGSQATRRYAKRQYTWLRHQPPVHWPRITLDNSPSSSLIEALLHD
jgi:tRNA dimethylallyltransferase